MKPKYAAQLTLGERGQVVIPKATRDRLGLKPKMKIRLVEGDGEMRLTPERDVAYLDQAFRKWRGTGRKSLLAAGYKDVDDYIEDVRGR